ncbi:hypothetical protein [Stutzerimonas stutzeri]|uniref:hypothetical protein n=1 Tax=Stutzerimonas stutzeri TaxID=316 RepID=UPI000F7B8A50|nr:hypothetical protein [Stutzerimonas stutzeri]RRW19694.1 hypothetical protein EGJ45_07400 [Stutzerimonas stutzeri]RRW25344.1 hypothetical protein EGJ36_09560 [Stutzerimonas stutzeri]
MIFKREQDGEAVSSALPSEVLAALDGAAIYARQPGEDGAPRVIVQPVGFGGFIYDHTAAADFVAAAFPELNVAQASRAARYIGSLVSSYLRQTEQDMAEPRRNWATNW